MSRKKLFRWIIFHPCVWKIELITASASSNSKGLCASVPPQNNWLDYSRAGKTTSARQPSQPKTQKGEATARRVLPPGTPSISGLVYDVTKHINLNAGIENIPTGITINLHRVSAHRAEWHLCGEVLITQKLIKNSKIVVLWHCPWKAYLFHPPDFGVSSVERWRKRLQVWWIKNHSGVL